jgi:hypothetical protein
MTSPILGLAKTVGKAFNGVFLDAVLTREIPGDGPAYDPGEPTIQTFNMKALAESYGSYTRGQGLVAATDMKVMILATSLSVQPQPLDKIEIAAQGFSGRIVAGDTAGTPAVSTDPAKCVWECRAST